MNMLPSPIDTIAQAYWDQQAPHFDNEPDHGLRDSVVRQAWQERLATWLPTRRVRVLDIGCGTGSLSLALAEAGHDLLGIDFAPAMIAQAAAKARAAGYAIPFAVMDAAHPALAPGQFDVILCRHLLWALAEPGAVLARWQMLLRPGGRLVLIEGFWHTGGGLPAQEILALLPPTFNSVVHDLSGTAQLWGGPVQDERYAIVAVLTRATRT